MAHTVFSALMSRELFILSRNPKGYFSDGILATKLSVSFETGFFCMALILLTVVKLEHFLRHSRLVS